METYDLQQAYDVADMLKQYFRELPDTLLTAKMSDTFIAIFQRKRQKTNFITIHFRTMVRKKKKCVVSFL